VVDETWLVVFAVAHGATGSGSEAPALRVDALLAAVLGATVAATLAWLGNRRSLRNTTAFEMHREYFDTLVGARDATVRFIASHPEGTLDEHWRSVEAAEMLPIWQIVYFYERLWVAVKHRRISRHLVVDLFGDSFNYWYDACFAKQLLPVDDPTARHIGELHKRLLALADAEQIKGWARYREVWRLDAAVNSVP
jgi:hypothetical protein